MYYKDDGDDENQLACLDEVEADKLEMFSVKTNWQLVSSSTQFMEQAPTHLLCMWRERGLNIIIIFGKTLIMFLAVDVVEMWRVWRVTRSIPERDVGDIVVKTQGGAEGMGPA